jgi:hypothetical protein
MAFIYGDPNSAGPFATFQIKDVVCKDIKLTFANFATGNVDTNVAAIPADATILGFDLWVKTQLAGNSISAATISIGSSSGGTQFASALAAAFGAAGVATKLSPVTGIHQAYNPPYTSDINIWVRGNSTTGTPTSGEMYLTIYYVR